MSEGKMEPAISKSEALSLIKKLRIKFREIDDTRRSQFTRPGQLTLEFAQVNYLDLYELLTDLEKLEERVEWGI